MSFAQPTIQWQKTFGGTQGDETEVVQQTTDGGYIVAGYSASSANGDVTGANHGFADYWIVKLNPAGIIVWQNTIGGTGNDGLGDIKQTSDGGYIICGGSVSGISGDKTEVNN